VVDPLCDVLIYLLLIIRMTSITRKQETPSPSMQSNSNTRALPMAHALVEMFKHHFSTDLRLAESIQVDIAELHIRIVSIGVRRIRNLCAAVAAGSRLDYDFSNRSPGLGT
jgi:hypothetical protein